MLHIARIPRIAITAVAITGANKAPSISIFLGCFFPPIDEEGGDLGRSGEPLGASANIELLYIFDPIFIQIAVSK